MTRINIFILEICFFPLLALPLHITIVKIKKRRYIQLILSLAALLVIGSTMLLNSPWLQRRVTVILATELENRIGTRVNLKGVHWLFPNDIVIDSLTIDDQEGEQLLAVKRIAAKIEWMPLLDRQLSIRNIRLFSPNVAIYQGAENIPNYQFLIDAFNVKKDDKPSRLNLRINSLLIRHANLQYDIPLADSLQTPQTPRHIGIEDLTAHISLKALTNDSLSVIARQLAFKERSGLQINNLYFRLVGNRYGATLANFHLDMPHTSLRLDTIWASYSPDNFKESFIIKGKMHPSYITLQDLGGLVPEIKDFRERIYLEADFIGGTSRFNLKNLSIHTSGRDIELLASGTASLKGTATDAIDINLHKAALTPNAWNIMETQLPCVYQQIPVEITRMGKVDIKGDIDLKKIKSRISLQTITDAGIANALMEIDDKGKYTTTIKGEDINIAQLIPTSPLTRTDLALTAEGIYNYNAHHEGLPLRGTFKGEATNTQLLGYTYQSIRLNGDYAPEGYGGNITLNDPNGSLILDAAYSTGAIPQYSVNLIADSLNLHAMNLIRIHEGNAFSTHLTGKIKGPDFNHMTGFIHLDTTTMHRKEGDYTINNIKIKSLDPGQLDLSGSRQKFILLQADFMEGNIQGDFTYQTLGESLLGHLYNHLPSLCNDSKHTHKLHGNSCTAEFNISDTTPLRELFLMPIEAEKEIQIKAAMDDNQKTIRIGASIPQLTYDEQILRGIDFDYKSTPHNMALTGSGAKESKEGTKISVDMNANANNDKVNLNVAWRSFPTKLFEGKFQTEARFTYTNDNQLTFFIESDSSSVTINHAAWKLYPFHVYVAPKHTTIKDFRFEHSDTQFLSINGTIADTPSDTLQIDINNLELGYLLSLVKLEGISFGGNINGQINAADLYTSSPYLDANIHAKDFTFCEGRMGDTQAHAQWNQDSARLEFTADIEEDSRHTTYVDGLVDIADNELWIDIDADSTNISFLNSMLSSFMTDIHGHANGHITVGGKMDSIDLEGTLFAEAKTKLIPTNVEYQLRDSIRLTPGKIVFNNIVAYDKQNQRAVINGAVTHDKLKDYAYNLDIKAHNVLGIDLPDTGNDSFYTTIRGTGNIQVNGGPNRPLRIDIDARPEAGSEFALNLTNHDVTSNESFIVFRDRATQRNRRTTDSDQQAQRRRRTVQSTTPLELNINANVTQDAKLKLIMDQSTDDHISAYGNGELKININNDDIKLSGEYIVNRGDYHLNIQDFINKSFTVLEGSTVNFNGDPMDARLNITARHTVNNVSLTDLSPELTDKVRANCLLNIEGTLNEPSLSFDIELPQGTEEQKSILRSYTSTEEQKNMQFVYLIGVGKFYTQDITQNLEGGAGDMESFLSNTISGQINNLLTNVINNDNWNIASSISTDNTLGATTETWDNMEFEGILEGRMLNNRLLINGNFGYRENSIYASNFIGDFDVRYLLTPSLSAKIYNKTNDRYFTKNSLYTQGVGLLYQKDFDYLFSRRATTESVRDTIP